MNDEIKLVKLLFQFHHSTGLNSQLVEEGSETIEAFHHSMDEFQLNSSDKVYSPLLKCSV